jgi:hypothetical protein
MMNDVQCFSILQIQGQGCHKKNYVVAVFAGMFRSRFPALLNWADSERRENSKKVIQTGRCDGQQT